LLEDAAGVRPLAVLSRFRVYGPVLGWTAAKIRDPHAVGRP
jgi:hypothetical protein